MDGLKVWVDIVDEQLCLVDSSIKYFNDLTDLFPCRACFLEPLPLSLLKLDDIDLEVKLMYLLHVGGGPMLLVKTLPKSL